MTPMTTIALIAFGLAAAGGLFPGIRREALGTALALGAFLGICGFLQIESANAQKEQQKHLQAQQAQMRNYQAQQSRLSAAKR